MICYQSSKKKIKYSYIIFLKSINHIRLLCVIKYVVSLTFSKKKKIPKIIGGSIPIISATFWAGFLCRVAGDFKPDPTRYLFRPKIIQCPCRD